MKQVPYYPPQIDNFLNTVVFSDADLVVTNKPTGLLSVPGIGEEKLDCALTRLAVHFGELHIVHRLDMATSGLLLMARGAAMQKALNQAFAEGAIQKHYVAEVVGLLETSPNWHMVDLPIAVDWPRRPLRIIDSAGKPSQTRWRCLSQDPGRQCSRVELQPLTGRSHQLRVHMQALGHPILGDALYAQPHVQQMASRLHLHASRLAFAHPRSGQAMQWECPTDF